MYLYLILRHLKNLIITLSCSFSFISLFEVKEYIFSLKVVALALTDSESSSFGLNKT